MKPGETITGYGTSYSYDVMGNMLSLSRYGDISAGIKELVDNLTMTYDGNRLVSVQDAAQAVTMSGSMDYPDGGLIDMTEASPRYVFFLHDHLGSVRVAAMLNGMKVQTNLYYPYGMSYASSALAGSGSSTVEDGGDIQVFPGGSIPEIPGTPEIAEEYISTIPYRFCGKEQNLADGLGMYDFLARRYDPVLCRFTSPDPLAEKYPSVSPYAYCANDPVNKVDPDGKELVIWYKENGQSHSYHYSGGECTSSNSYVQAVVTAYHYNKTNWHKAGYPGKSQTELVVERKEIINVANADIAGDSFSSVYNTIYWSPELGTKNENGTVTSPATDFDHEADHANATIDGTRGSSQNREELRVINGSEQKMAKANGDINPNQVTRTNHKGSIVVTTGVMSNEIDQQKTKEYEKRRNDYNPFAQD